MNSRRTPFDDIDSAFDPMLRSMERMMGTFGADRSGLRGRADAMGDRLRGSEAGTNFTMDRVDGGYVVLADIPGFEKSEIDVTVQDGEITISAERETGEESESHSLRRRRSVRRTMSLPEGVVVDEISASYHNGVLEIELPADLDADDATHVQID